MILRLVSFKCSLHARILTKHVAVSVCVGQIIILVNFIIDENQFAEMFGTKKPKNANSDPPEMHHRVRLNAQQSNVTGVDMEVPMYTLKTSQSAGTLSSTRSSLDFETVVSDFLNPFD